MPSFLGSITSKASTSESLSARQQTTHMPASMTQKPEPQILYEHCVRPSDVRTGLSQSEVVQVTFVSRSVQTEPPRSAPTPSPTRLSGLHNVELHSDTSEAASRSASTQRRSRPQSPAQGPRSVSRSVSRDSLSTWPPASTPKASPEPLPRYAVVQPPPRRLQQQPRHRSSSVPTPGAVFNMPVLPWGCVGDHLRAQQRVKRVIDSLGNFLLLATILLLFSTLLQWSFVLRSCPPVNGASLRREFLRRGQLMYPVI